MAIEGPKHLFKALKEAHGHTYIAYIEECLRVAMVLRFLGAPDASAIATALAPLGVQELLEPVAAVGEAEVPAAQAAEDVPEASEELPAQGEVVEGLHVVLHSPLVALRREPSLRSPVARYVRCGAQLRLGDCDATQQWRRVQGEEAWMPLRHPTLGPLVKQLGEEEPEMTVQEAWRQLYEAGVLNMPPPEQMNEAMVASKALVQAAQGLPATEEGEKALAQLDVETVRYVMTAALEHLKRPKA